MSARCIIFSAPVARSVPSAEICFAPARTFLTCPCHALLDSAKIWQTEFRVISVRLPGTNLSYSVTRRVKTQALSWIIRVWLPATCVMLWNGHWISGASFSPFWTRDLALCMTVETVAASGMPSNSQPCTDLPHSRSRSTAPIQAPIHHLREPSVLDGLNCPPLQTDSVC